MVITEEKRENTSQHTFQEICKADAGIRERKGERNGTQRVRKTKQRWRNWGCVRNINIQLNYSVQFSGQTYTLQRFHPSLVELLSPSAHLLYLSLEIEINFIQKIPFFVLDGIYRYICNSVPETWFHYTEYLNQSIWMDKSNVFVDRIYKFEVNSFTFYIWMFT